MIEGRIGRRRFLAAAAGAGLVAAGAAPRSAAPRLEVGPIRRVGVEGSKYFEPWIAAHPADPATLIVVGSLRLGGVDRREPAAFVSTDGGATWAAAALPGLDRLRGPGCAYADACATYAPDGTAFCVFLGGPGGTEYDLWIYRSTDGGRRWEGPTRVGGFLDYPRLVADLDGGRPRLFVAANGPGDGAAFGGAKRPGYGCVILRSDDGARTFSAVHLLAPTALLHTPIESPLILPDGRLLVGFADFSDMPEEGRPRDPITHNRYYAAASGDGGSTFSLPAPIRDARLRDGHAEGFAAIAVDRSGGPNRGRVYALGYTRGAGAGGLQLQSGVGGVDWTRPAPIPGLRAGPCPYAALAVSPGGVIGVSWIQGDPGDPATPQDRAWAARPHAFDLYFSASTDGGATFAEPAPLLSRSRTDPEMRHWAFGGDYLSLAASADGAFHPLWVETRDGLGSIQTARVVVRP